MTTKEAKINKLGQVLNEDLKADMKTSVLDKSKQDWQLVQVPLEAIETNPNQPRKEFNEVSIRELADSIEENGLLQPLVARPIKDEKFQLIAGERRLRALRMLERATAPVVIRDTEDPSELSLIENIQREDLNPIDLAESLQRLKIMREITDEEIGRLLGKSRSWVTESILISTLDPEIKQKAKEKNLSRSVLVELRRDKSKLNSILEGKDPITVRNVRGKSNGEGKEKKYRFFYRSKTGAFSVLVQFPSKAKASKDEIRRALKEASQAAGKSN